MNAQIIIATVKNKNCNNKKMKTSKEKLGNVVDWFVIVVLSIIIIGGLGFLFGIF